jgi:hypothetical protein
MANPLRTYETRIISKRASSQLDKLQREFQTENFGTHQELLAKLFRAFRKAFKGLDEPVFEPRHHRDYPYSKDYNKNKEEIVADIFTLFEEEDVVEELLAHNFNFTDVLSRRMINNAKTTKSLIRRFRGLSESDIVYSASDSFNSQDIIDRTLLSADMDEADIITEEGVLTLNRLENINIIKNATVSWRTLVPGVEADFAPSRFNKDFTKNPAANTIGLGVYEGMYYGKRDEWRPEGDKWHIENDPLTGVKEGGLTGITGVNDLALLKFPSLRDQGANDAELQKVRKRAIDGNPDTFWEVELLEKRYGNFTVNGVELDPGTIDSLDVDTASKNAMRIQEGKEIGDNPQTGGRFIGELVFELDRARVVNWVSLKPNNFGQVNYLRVKDILTSSDTNGEYVSIDDFLDSPTTFVISDENTRELNREELFATLSPDRYSQLGTGVWTFAPRNTRRIKFILEQDTWYAPQYEVVAMATGKKDREGGDGAYISFTMGSSGTATVRTSVQDPEERDYSLQMSNDRKYRVTSVEVTAKKEAKQEVGNVTAKIIINGGEAGAASFSWPVRATTQDTQIISLPFVDETTSMSVEVDGGGTATGFDVKVFYEDAGPIGGEQEAGEDISFLEANYDIVELSYLKSVQTYTTGGLENMTTGAQAVNPGDNYLANWWWRTKQDVKRYSIGVREVGAYAYKYSSASEFVSKEFRSPFPIRSMELSVRESVPSAFTRRGSLSEWIQYFISVDGINWEPISPKSRSFTSNIPRIIYVNSDLPLADNEKSLGILEDVYSVRLKIILKRPTSGENVEMYTPIVRDFAIRIYT